MRRLQDSPRWGQGQGNWICAVAAVALIAAIIAYFLWVPGPQEPAVATLEPLLPSQERIDDVVQRLQKLAALQPDNAETTQTARDLVNRVRAVRGDRKAAFQDGVPKDLQMQATLLAELQRGQLRAGKMDEVKETTRELLNLLDKVEEGFEKLPPARAKPIELTIARACARIKDYDGIRRVLSHPTITGKKQSAVAYGVTKLFVHLKDTEGALLTAKVLAPEQRTAQLLLLFSDARGRHHPVPVSVCRRTLELIPAGATDRDALQLMNAALMELCRERHTTEAAEYVANLPQVHDCRYPWLSAITRLQAQQGKALEASGHAERAGYLVLAAELQLHADKPAVAAKNLDRVVAALEPLKQLQDGLPGRHFSPVSERLDLLRRIAVAQYRAGQAKGAEKTLQAMRELVPHAGSQQAWFVSQIEGAEADASVATLAATGKLPSALATAQRLAARVQKSDGLARLWTAIGVAQWRAKEQDAARASFKRAVDCTELRLFSGQHQPVGHIDILKARAEAGDAYGAAEMVPSTFRIHLRDETIGHIAEELALQGDVPAALKTISVLSVHGQSEQLKRIVMVQAKRDGFEAAFATYFKVRGVGDNYVPVELMVEALKKDRVDLVVKHLNSCDTRHVTALLAAVEGDKSAVKKLLDRVAKILPERNQRHVGDDLLGLLDLMIEHDAKEHVPALMKLGERREVPASRRMLMLLRVGDIEGAVKQMKNLKGEINSRSLITAMEAVAAEVLPDDPDLDTGPYVAHKVPPDATRALFEETFYDMLFTRGARSRHSEPWVDPQAPPRAAPRPSTPAEPAWSVELLFEQARTFRGQGQEAAVVVMRAGQPVVFARIEREGRWRLVMLELKDSKWTAHDLGLEQSLGAFDAVAIGEHIYLALNLGQGIEIRCLAKGQWTTVHRTGPSDVRFGERLCLAAVDGRPMAVFTDKRLPGAAWTKSARFLELTADGDWKETKLPVPYNAGIICFRMVAAGNEPAVAFCSEGGFGKFFGQRRGNDWKFENVIKQRSTQLGMCPLGEGQLVFCAVPGKPAELWRHTGEWKQLSAPPVIGNVVCSDMALIGGKPTIAFVDGDSYKVHLLTVDNEKCTDRVLSLKSSLVGVQSVCLFEWDGHPALVAIAQTSSLPSVFLLRPDEKENH
ncbi:MAG: hypothetical protein AB7K24_24055 [Gemmataceae bacterium]